MYTWDQAVAKWQRERATRASESIRRENALLGFAKPYLQGRGLRTIGRADLERLRDRKRAQGAGPRTCNYLTQTVGAILRQAVRWEWIERAPAVERLPEPGGRECFLSHDQAGRLLAALPLHLARLVGFHLDTGLRPRNARLLEWRHVQWDRNRLYIPAAEMKARKPHVVPLTKCALLILRACRGDHSRYVFTYRGEPMVQPRNSAWYRVLRELGMTGVRWHDLRHTWASWHLEMKTELLELMRLGGWSTFASVARYAHLSDFGARRAVRRFERGRSKGRLLRAGLSRVASRRRPGAARGSASSRRSGRASPMRS